MTRLSDLVLLQDVDLLLEEARLGRGRPGAAAPGGVPALERLRGRLFDAIERRWSHAYERAQRRYGRAVVAVRERVCQGCFITLPTSSAAGSDALSVCESCGRILFRR